jgi:hypothetical protein
MVITINGRGYTDSELERLSLGVECTLDEFLALQTWLERRVKGNGSQRSDSTR